MPSYLDLGVIAVVFVSALLAMLRGFTREVLAIASWAAAAVAAYAFHPFLLPYVKPYIAKDQLALAAAAGAIFFVTLIVVSLVTVKLSDLILDSKIGALDRSLGFLFGAGRGYLLCAIAYVFFAWLSPNEKSQPTWVQNSKTRSWLEATGSSLQAMLPENLDTSLSKILKKKGGAGDEPPAESDTDKAPAPPPPARPGQRTQIEAAPPVTRTAAPSTIESVLGRDNPSPKR
ncbi:MAG: CvpA family protein [Isosphaeraceae bacterium]